MSDTDQNTPHVYGTLLVRDVPQARTVLGVLCCPQTEAEDDDVADGPLEELLSRIADLVDEVFEPAPAAGGPFLTKAQPYLAGPGGTPEVGGFVNVQTTSPAIADRAVRVRAEKFLDTCATLGVGGYIEVDIDGRHPERTVHVLTPTGLFSEAAPSRFANA